MNSSLHHAPYIRHPESCRTIMGDTLISLLPLYFMSYFYYGPRVLVIGAVAVLTCLAADWLCSYLTYRRVNLRDLSAAVTGVIISMLMPPAIPDGHCGRLAVCHPGVQSTLWRNRSQHL